MNQPSNKLLKSRNVTALAVGVLLTAAQFVSMYYDARQGVADYRGRVATALPAHR
jgi:hypothetical protein